MTGRHTCLSNRPFSKQSGLPPDKQQELLSHASSLRQQARPSQPFKSVRGLWSDLGISLSAEEIDDSQREMWKNFPREDI